MTHLPLDAPIVNTWEQLVASGGGIAVTPHLSPTSHRATGWAVLRVDATGKGLVTDNRAAWNCYGRKVFSYFGAKDKGDVLAEAFAWVAEQYGETGPWVRNAQRDYVPARVQKAHPIRRAPAKKAAVSP